MVQSLDVIGVRHVLLILFGGLVYLIGREKQFLDCSLLEKLRLFGRLRLEGV